MAAQTVYIRSDKTVVFEVFIHIYIHTHIFIHISCHVFLLENLTPTNLTITIFKVGLVGYCISICF